MNDEFKRQGGSTSHLEWRHAMIDGPCCGRLEKMRKRLRVFCCGFVVCRLTHFVSLCHPFCRLIYPRFSPLAGETCGPLVGFLKKKDGFKMLWIYPAKNFRD